MPGACVLALAVPSCGSAALDGRFGSCHGGLTLQVPTLGVLLFRSVAAESWSICGILACASGVLFSMDSQEGLFMGERFVEARGTFDVC
jgi:hypothetical protein